MVQFVSVANILKFLARSGVEPHLVGLARYLEEDFSRWEAFEKAPRIPSHSPGGVIELMPTSDGETYSFKYVNGHPGNTRKGLQTVTAFGVLADVTTGYPRFVAEMTVLTAVRTAAVSAMAAKHLARPESRVMAMIGNGAQSEFQALAFKAVNEIEEVRLYDIDPAATDKCARNLAGSGLRIVRCGSAPEAVAGADIVTTVTADKRRSTILTDNMVGAGVHINAIGGDSPGKTELHPDILKRAGIFVELTAQSRVEGEIQQLPQDYPVTELWEVVTGRRPGRTDGAQITLFDSVGFAVEDFSALRYLRDRVRGTQFVEELDLIAEPDDSRDLFGLIDRAGRQSGGVVGRRGAVPAVA
ncbi:ornithine cyclodeaminase [Devosia nitrariae]|uniref:Ornithine cyclodeaminase n=1 Tax=Devosia nitrariae TaxID=2071872 RepID=A0ABQ5W5P2_9HYPH|nr:ornithine cyclodeaminase [Devosia nitrariae]GLQ55251.1 ornithine cyclodeaminase [Devosia nitrariae]